MIINNVNFVEDAQNKSPVLRFAAENCACTRRLYVPYPSPAGYADPDGLYLAAVALLGGSEVKTENVAGDDRAYVARTLPHGYPQGATFENPVGFPVLFAASIPTAEPCGAPTEMDEFGRTAYSWYRFTVNYESRPDNVFEDSAVLATGQYEDDGASPLAGSVALDVPARPDEGDALRRGWRYSRWVVKQVDPASRTLTLRQGLVYFQEGPAAGQGAQRMPEGLPFTQARDYVTYTHLCVPWEAVPQATIRLYRNRCNDAEFDGYPAGTLLFADHKLRLYRTAGGRRVADVQYKMIYLPNRDPVTGFYWGHNGVPRVMNTVPPAANDGKLRIWPISSDGATFAADGSNMIVPYADFADLFRPEWPYVW